MASITQRGETFSVIFDYRDEYGKRKQKWETVSTYEEALRLKASIETARMNRSRVQPLTKTVTQFFDEWMPIHAKKKWSYHTYQSYQSILTNHIAPYIGSLQLQSLTAYDIDKLYSSLLSKSRATGKKENDEYAHPLSPTTVGSAE